MKKVQCSCGMDNQLVETEEGLRYDITKHGNGELCKGLCFNCRAPLKGLSPEPAAKTEPEPKPVEKPIDEAVNKPVEKPVEKPRGKKKKKL